MNPIASICFTVLLASSVYGGTRVIRQGWNSPPPSSGWGAPPANPDPTLIDMVGVSEAFGEGAAVAEHNAVINVEGGWEAPAVLSVNTGSSVGLYQSASNYQQSIISPDGSSEAYQGNVASNSGYADDYLGATAQGSNIDVTSNGWSAVQGIGIVSQGDELVHEGSAPGAGWPARS